MTGPPDGDRRLHPLTPLLRGWAVVAAVLFFVVRNLHDLSQDITPDRVGLGLLLLVPAALVYGFLSWRFTRYRIEPDRLRLQSGVLFRRTRHLRLDRLQSVDIVRPFAARLTGLAVLRFDLAGGERDTSTLQYLTLAQAVELRDELLSRASGADPAAPRSPDQVLFSLSTGRLLASIALTLGPWASLVLIGVAFLPTLVNDSVTGLIAALPVLAGFWHTTFRRFAESYGFTVTESPDGLRISSGLVNSRHHTVPPGRVQAVRIDEPLLWRRTGWARIEINVAGKHDSTVLLPVAPRAEALELLARVLPGAAVDEVPLTPPPRRARWIAPLLWSRSRCGADGRVFVSRKGLIRRRTEVVAHAKPQSIALSQNPLTARLRLATVELHSTKGPVRVTARLRDLDEAGQMLAEQAERSRLGRRTDVPARWIADRWGPGGGTG